MSGTVNPHIISYLVTCLPVRYIILQFGDCKLMEPQPTNIDAISSTKSGSLNGDMLSTVFKFSMGR